MFPIRLLAFPLLFTLALMDAGEAHAQWVQTNGPNSGDITAIMVTDSEVVAADWDNDLFLSTDVGNTWNHVGQGLPDPYIWALYQYGGYLFAGMESNGIFRTHHGTWKWNPSDSGIQGQEILSITSLGRYLIASSYGAGIYRSSDTGLTWMSCDTGLKDSVVRAVEVLGTTVIAGTDHGCFASSDSGASWNLIDTSLQNVSIQTLTQNQGILFAGAWGRGIFRSVDSGKHWSQINNGLFGNALYVGSIQVMGKFLFASSDSGIYQSTDTGNTWRPSSLKITSVGDAILACLDSILFASFGFDYGVFRSLDSGSTWVSCGLPNTYIEAMGSYGNQLFAGEDYNTVYRSADGGANWDNSKSGIGYSIVMAFDANDGAVFAGSYDGVYRSTDSGNTWSVPNPSLTYTYVHGITHAGSTLIAGTEERGILRSTDNGLTWSLSNNGLTDTTVFSVVQAHGIFFAGTNHSLFRSVDSGLTWSLVLGLPDYPEEALFADDSLLMVGVYRSTNLGKTWNLNYTGPSDSFIQCFAEAGNLLFAGTMKYFYYRDTSYIAQPSGVFVSSDRGVHWMEADTGLPISTVNGLAVVDGFLYAGTYGSGVWRRPLSDFGISSVAQTPAMAGSEIQVYPNPSSGSTTVSFMAAVSGYAEVSIVNMLGEEVARLYAGELAAGEHSFAWGAGALPAGALPCAPTNGVYECLVRMNGVVQSKGIVVMR